MPTFQQLVECKSFFQLLKCLHFVMSLMPTPDELFNSKIFDVPGESHVVNQPIIGPIVHSIWLTLTCIILKLYTAASTHPKFTGSYIGRILCEGLLSNMV